MSSKSWALVLLWLSLRCLALLLGERGPKGFAPSESRGYFLDRRGEMESRDLTLWLSVI